MEEVRERFGDGSPEREAQMVELGEFLRWCRQAGVKRVVINGSFVTGKLSPLDVDVIVLPRSADEQHQLPNDLVFPSSKFLLPLTTWIWKPGRWRILAPTAAAVRKE